MPDLGHHHDPSRRLLLLGALSAPLALGVLATVDRPGAAAAQDGVPARARRPECLADLIESGEVTRADLVAR